MGAQIDACRRFEDCDSLGLVGGFAGGLLGNGDVGVAFVVFGGDPVEVGFDGLGRGDSPGSDLGSKLCRRSLTQRPVGRDASADRVVRQNSLEPMEAFRVSYRHTVPLDDTTQPSPEQPGGYLSVDAVVLLSNRLGGPKFRNRFTV